MHDGIVCGSHQNDPLELKVEVKNLIFKFFKRDEKDLISLKRRKQFDAVAKKL